MDNIESYSVEELVKMFQLTTPLTQNIINAAMDAYKRSDKNSNIVAQRFIEAAGKKLLNSIKIKTRHESTSYNYDAHSVLTQLKQPKKNFTYQLESTPDYLNPTFQNTVTRIINLDSKFRDDSYPVTDAITGQDSAYKFSSYSVTIPKQCLEPTKLSSTQYTAYLSDPLTDVVSLKLYNVTIPYLWYNIDKIYGNNFFQYISDSSSATTVNREDLSSIMIPTGQYNLMDDANNIYTAINNKIKQNAMSQIRFELDPLTQKTIINFYSKDYSGNYISDNGLKSPPFTLLWYNILNITNQNIKANNNLGWKLGFRSELSYIINKDEDNKSGAKVYYIDFSTGFSPLGSEIYLDILGLNNCYFNSDKTISYDASTNFISYKNEPVYKVTGSSGDIITTDNSNQHNSPGNIWREYPAISGKLSIRWKYIARSDAPVDLRLTKYLLLSIEDYNNNQLNSGLISIQSTEKNVKIDSKKYGLKISECPDVQSGKNYYQYSTGNDISNTILGITKAQITSINAVAKLRARPSNKSIAPTDSIFAMIKIPEDNSIKFGQTITNNDITLLNNERKYFGPITIGSLKIKLLTEDGNVLNLNKTDWSVALLCKQLYQY